MTEFLQAMIAAGLTPIRFDPVADGRIHRFRVDGDKAGSRNGWCVLYHDHGAFGSWKTGEQHTWRAEIDATATPEKLAELRRQSESMRRQRAEDEFRVRESARAKAARLWGLAKPADASHPYLVRKGIKAYGARQLRDSLVIPVRDASGTLHTLQFIDQDGGKRFLTGGRTRGCYCAIGRPASTLLLAEGFATAATLHEATGRATACAFNAGNLLPVALSLRAKFPELEIIVCADDDRHTPGNPGLTKAREAAAAVDGRVAAPQFEGITQ